MGVVTSCPTNAGTGMRASVHIPLPNLCKDGTEKKAKEICKPLGLSVRGAGGIYFIFILIEKVYKKLIN